MAGNRRAVEELNREELKRGIAGDLRASWHADYRDTSWIFIGGLSRDLSEGDVLCIFSQYGEIEDFHLVRDEDTGESRGFGFLKYEDFRSTVLAVDNFNNATILGRQLHVDHTRYERPKKKKDEEAKLSVEEHAKLQEPGHAYIGKELMNEHSLQNGVNPFTAAQQEADVAGVANSESLEHSESRSRSEKDPDRRSRADSEERSWDRKRSHKHHKSSSKHSKSKKRKHHRDSRKEVGSGDESDEDAERRRHKRSRKEKKKKDRKSRRTSSPRKHDSRSLGEMQDMPLDSQKSLTVMETTQVEAAPLKADETQAEKRKRYAALANLPVASWKG